MKGWWYSALYILLSASVALCHIPMRYAGWAEPNTPVRTVNLTRSAITAEKALERLTALREVMNTREVNAYVIPTADAHSSEYISPTDARREWISGFTGSAGTAVVTDAHALVWTDSRYYLQFDMEVNTEYWQLMKAGDTSIPDWLAANLGPLAVVAVDPTTYTRAEFDHLEGVLAKSNMKLISIDDNLVDLARNAINDPAPVREFKPLLPLGVDYTGKKASDKISALITQINSKGAVALVLSALDDIAYTLNLRGSDIPYNPVFFSFLVIRTDMSTPSIILFWSSGTLAPDVVQHLSAEGVTVETHPYTEIYPCLKELSTSAHGGIIWLTDGASYALYSSAEYDLSTEVLSTISPVALMKCVKNEVELKGFRDAHVRDGVAVVRFLHWLHEQVPAGNNVTELDVVRKLEEFRQEEKDFMGPSFETIAGAGANGAIIHYSPSETGPQTLVGTRDMLLVDSGGQFKDGTTDITRTRHMSIPTQRQRDAFTRVLKGQIALGSAVFPRGIMGHVLEILARKSLWDAGLDYAHGTGHGVGHYLNVHEGPGGILASPVAGDPGLHVGMVYSNEPGYYEEGEYGIRHEDLIEVIEIDKDSDHIQAASLLGNFAGAGTLAFRTLSLAPHQTSCLDVALLNDFEIKYINDYHARVLATLGPILQQRNLTEDYDWLEKECAPIGRNAAILIYLSPFMVIASVTISKIC